MAGASSGHGPLAGVTVIDLSRALAGPYATMMLADAGADVIKIERPGAGDDSRGWGPPFVGDGDDRQSAYFLSVNRSKRSVVLDLKQDADLARLRDLLGDADVLVENFRPGAMRRLGLDYDTLKEKHASLVYASISGFGQNGPEQNLEGPQLVER
jgi:crotonobetainyl-CoA:carnitine CoA-transferase CaiB-like acyl-CoA transferase